MSEGPESYKGSVKTSAGIAGAGGGTLLAVIASQLDDGSPLKPWLIYASPSVSIVLGGIWVWIQVEAINFLRDRRARKVIEDAKASIRQALSNSSTSPQHKKILQERLEQFEMVSIDRAMSKLKNEKVISFDDLSHKE